MVYFQRWHGWCHVKLLPSRRILCTPYNHTPCHFMQSHIRKVHACLAVTCHLHCLNGTAVTRKWNGYRNKSQHRKQSPNTGLRLTSFNHCRISLRHRVQKTQLTSSFLLVLNSSKFVTSNSDKTRRVIYSRQQSLHQHK